MMHKDCLGVGARVRRFAAVFATVAFLVPAVAGSAFAEVGADGLYSDLLTEDRAGDTPQIVGFGGHEWMVIAYDGHLTGDSLSGEDSWWSVAPKRSVTLFALDDFGESAYNSGGPNYVGGDLQKAMENAYNSLPDAEKALVLPRSGIDYVKDDGTSGLPMKDWSQLYIEVVVGPDGGSFDVNLDGLEKAEGAYTGTAAVLDGQAFWPLSAGEWAFGTGYKESKTVDKDFWLRDPWPKDPTQAMYVSTDQDLLGADVADVKAVRPTFNLSVFGTILTSAASGPDAKSSVKVGDGFVEVKEPDGPIKLTVVDDEHLKGEFDIDKGTGVLTYSNVTTGPNHYISGVLTSNLDDSVLAYAKLADVSTKGSGTVDIKPLVDAYRESGGKCPEEGQVFCLTLFTEQANGDNETDFISRTCMFVGYFDDAGGLVDDGPEGKEIAQYSKTILTDWQKEPYWSKMTIPMGDQSAIGDKNGPRAVTIGFGGEEWYLIGHDEYVGNLGAYWLKKHHVIDSAMLLSKNGYGKVAFNSQGNDYNGGDLQALLDDVYQQLPAKEQALIIPYQDYQAKAVADGDLQKPAIVLSAGPSHVTTESLNNVKLWPLSYSDAEIALDQVGASILSFGDDWWVQPMDYSAESKTNDDVDDSDDDSAEVIKADGKDLNFGDHKVTESLPARPAVNLDLSNLFFTSPASGANTKESVKVGDGFVPIDNGNGPVKLTVFDPWSAVNSSGQKKASVTETNPQMESPYNFTGASAGNNTYVSAVLTYRKPFDYWNEEVIAYAKLTELTQESGSFDIWTPFRDFLDRETSPEGHYSAYVYSEELNGDNSTDFASEPWNVYGTSIDRTPPVPGGQGEIRIKNAKEASLTLEWTAATDNMVDSEYLCYSIYQKEGSPFTIGSNGLPTDGTFLNRIPYQAGIAYPTENMNITSYDITGLDPDKTYYFLVVVSTEYNLLDTPGVFEWSDRFYKQGV
ncbi:MAG: hypothetical protein LBR44_10600, partial [Clostridiales Family XIII bacterium]|nr:hypothetical protein [Clostridiales Family XIII bacterium]